MKKVFIKLTAEEAIAAKKEFLSAQVNMLELLKRLKAYKNLRRRELLLKEKIKMKVPLIRQGQKEIEHIFPIEAMTVEDNLGGIPTKTLIKKLPTREEFQEIQDNKNIEAQLQEIKEKLAQFG